MTSSFPSEDVISTLPDVILLLDESGEIVYLNRRGEKLLKLSSRKMKGRLFSSLLSPDSAAGVIITLRRMRAGDFNYRRWDVEVAVRPGRIMELALSRRKNGFSGVIREVTDNRSQFSRLRQMAGVLESIQESVIITDRKNRIAYVNPASEKMLGYPRSELIGAPAGKYFEGIPGNPPSLAEYIKDHSNGRGWEGEIYDRRADGTLFPVHLTLTRIDDEEGRSRGYVGISHDITSLRAVEEARHRYTERIEEEVKKRTEELHRTARDLAVQEARLDAIVSNIAEGVVVEDKHYQVKFINKTLLKKFGPAGEKKCYQYFIGRNSPCPVCGIKEIIRKKRDYFCYELVDRDGRTCEIVASPLIKPDGDRQVIEILRDITERKKNEALICRKNLQLTEINRELKKLLKTKSDFLSLVSHELKSPLTVVEGYLNLFQRRQLGSLTPEQSKALSVAAEEAGHLDSLINQILDLAQLDSGGFELQKSEFSIREVVDRCRTVLAEKADQRKVSFLLKLSPPAERAFGDVQKIRQVFRNIMENALKFSPKKGKVLIRGEKKNDYLIFSIQDEGIGISEGELEQIFEKFYQTKNPRSQKEGGIGLGLAISKNIIELHGGRIWAESGEGARILFTLPIAK